MSGAGDLSLAGVLMLDQVSVLHLAGGDKTHCAHLCRADCLRWDWQAVSQSCILDHRQDLRGVGQEEEKVRKTTERRPKPKRKTSKPSRRTTRRPASTTASTAPVTPVSTQVSTEKSQRKTGGKRKPGQRKPQQSTKGKTLMDSEEIAEVQQEAKE